MLYAIVGMLVIILDQGVKFWVTNHIMLNTVTEPLIPGVISLVRMHNDGAAFSFLAGGGARIYFIILTGVFTVAVILALITNFINGRFGRWCLVLVTAGGLSNCLDRVLYGYVVDMFKLELFDFAVFNVADIFITVFCLLFIIYIIFGGEDKKKAEDEFDEDDEDLDRPKFEKRDRKAERLAAKEDKAAAKLAKRDKKRGSKYESDEEDEFIARFGGKGRDAEAGATRSEGRRRASIEDVPQQRAAARRERPAAQSSEAPARRSANAPARKSRYEEDYEAFMASRPNAKAEIARKSAGASAADDPFAAWEKANARMENRHSSTAKAMGVQLPENNAAQQRRAPAARSAEAPARRAAATSADMDQRAAERAAARQAMREKAAAAAAAEAPARRERAAAQSSQAPARRAAALPGYEEEAAPARPAQRPAPAPAPKAEDSLEFSLDDILSEFR